MHTSRFSRRVALPAVAVILLSASGCGGKIAAQRDAGHSSQSSDAKVEFLHRGNEILCEKSDRVMRAVASQVLTGDEPSADEEAALALPALRTAAEQLADLPVPETERSEVHELLGAFRQAIAASETDPAELAGGSDPFVAVERRMADYGLDGCD